MCGNDSGSFGVSIAITLYPMWLQGNTKPIQGKEDKVNIRETEKNRRWILRNNKRNLKKEGEKEKEKQHYVMITP